MSCLIIDIGTSSCRASVVSSKGEIISTSRESVAVSVNGFSAEVDTDYVWDLVVHVIKQEVEKNPEEKINAIGVSSMLGYVFLDSDYKPLRPSIIWMDNRAKDEADEIKELFDSHDFCSKTGRRISSELLAPKILWLRKNEYSNYKRIHRVIGLKDEIVRRLTGIASTDYSHLNYSLLYNIGRGEIDVDIVSALNISGDFFPEGNSSEKVVGPVSKECSRLTGLTGGTPVVCGSSDGTAAMYGGGVLSPGKAVLVSGTTDVLMMKTDVMVENKNCILSVNNGMEGNSFLAGGAMGMSGGTLDRIFKLFKWDFNKTISKVKGISPGSGGLLFTPGLSGERAPYWLENMFGSIIGLSYKHEPEHIVRSLFEGISFRILRIIQELKSNGLIPGSINIVGGGSGIGIYNQIRADVTGIPVVMLKEPEATTLGTAIFCKKGIGDFSSLSETAEKWVTPKHTYLPDPYMHSVYSKLSGIFENYIKITEEVQNELKREDKNDRAKQ